MRARPLITALLVPFAGGCFSPGEALDDEPPSVVAPKGFHPAGYAAAEFHGIDANLQASDCRECHGEDLFGGDSEVSCDTAGCHAEDWRTDCTYCHGGDESMDGAPPRDLDGRREPRLAAFGAHQAHLDENDHPAFACTECHAEAGDIEDVLTPGHAFDDTPGRAEVAFGGLSLGGTYDAATRTCGNIYCHGNGAQPGRVTAGDDITCASCHPDQGSSEDAWENSLDDEHEEHLEDGIVCAHCHGAVVDEQSNIRTPHLHVNGVSEWYVDPSLGITVDALDRCSGQCHVGDDEDHDNEDWN